jgi:hypothetical protein
MIERKYARQIVYRLGSKGTVIENQDRIWRASNRRCDGVAPIGWNGPGAVLIGEPFVGCGLGGKPDRGEEKSDEEKEVLFRGHDDFLMAEKKTHYK